MIGKTVSHYRVVEPLGAGGMGVVYRGHDERLDRAVALKFLPPHLGVSNEIKQRFVNEARAASALDHANICTIHDIDETEDGQLFIVMALYEGESLRDRLVRGPMAALEVVDVGLQIAAGLAVAHDRGILHRDIKPANIFITDRGEAKILDFGLAKISGSTKITRTGTSMGTLNYMPPEQLRGEPVDARADVWALGAVLYEMLTGRAAFSGDNEGAVVYAVLESDPPPPSAIVPGLPSGLDRLLQACVAKEVAQRLSSVRALRTELESLRRILQTMDDQPTLAHPQAGSGADLPAPAPAIAAGVQDPNDSSVAVIDFTNITRDPTADWLSSGIAETLSVDLKKVSSLRVVGRQKVHAMLGPVDATRLDEETLLKLGGKIGARWLFWGGFQKLGDQIRLTAHCFDVQARETVETVKLDGTMREIFSLQDEILKALMGSLDLEVSEEEVREIERPETEDLEAYEYCAKARELTFNMRPEDFGQAAEYLRRAIELDPAYALAYSSFGQLHCFRFIGTTDPADLQTAVESLQRAVDLDPELGDPYGWLAYAYSRERHYSKAIESGRRAVELEPDNPQSHYFLAVALWLRGMDEFLIDGYPEALRHLQKVTRLVAKYQPGYQIQAGIYMGGGQYEQARGLLEVAAEIERTGDHELGKFVGAIGLLGRVAFRQGLPDEAARCYDQSLEVSGKADHVYTAACNAMVHCWRGDLERRRRRRNEAVRAYRAARDQVLESPRSLGIGWALLRSHLGLAMTLHQLEMRREALASYQKALDLLKTKQGYDFSGLWDGGDASMHLESAMYLALSHRKSEALEEIERGVRKGWRELPVLDSEPALESIRNEPRFRRIQADLAARPRLE